MRQDYSLRLPRDHGFDGFAQFRFIAQERHSQVTRCLAIRILHAAEARHPATDQSKLLRLEVLDEVGEHKRAGCTVKENEFGHVTAGNGKRRDSAVPGPDYALAEDIRLKGDFFAGLLPDAWCEIDPGMWIGLAPVRDPPIV